MVQLSFIKERQESIKLMQYVEYQFYIGNLESVNTFLSNLNVSEIGIRGIVGVVRASSRMRDKLPAWMPLYERSRIEITNRGRDPDILFIGLTQLLEKDA